MKFKTPKKPGRTNLILSKAEIVLVGIVLVITTFTMYYADITVTAQYSLCFIDSLFDGKPFSFYNNALMSGIAPEGAVYDVGMYIIFAIWNLPIWILGKIADINILGIFPLLWFKTLLIVFAYGTLWLLKKIASYLKFDEYTVKYLKWVYILAPLFVFPVLVAAQYDIIPLFFIMYGIWKWLEKDKIKWLAAFSLSFIMKPFSVFMFAILLLMEEKKITRIIMMGFVSLLPFGICKMVYRLNPGNCASNDNFFKEMFPKLLSVRFNIGSNEVSVFFLALILLYIAVYAHQQEDDAVLMGRQFIWYAFVLWAAFCMFTEVAPYWIIYLSPFLAIITFYNRSTINLMLILELIVNVGMVLLMIIQYPWVYGGQKTFSYLFMKVLYKAAGGEENVSTAAGLMRALNLEQFFPIISAAVLGALIACAFYSYKGIRDYNDECEELMIDLWHIRARILVLYAWMGVCLLLLII